MWRVCISGTCVSIFHVCMWVCVRVWRLCVCVWCLCICHVCVYVCVCGVCVCVCVCVVRPRACTSVGMRAYVCTGKRACVLLLLSVVVVVECK